MFRSFLRALPVANKGAGQLAEEVRLLSAQAQLHSERAESWAGKIES